MHSFRFAALACVLFTTQAFATDADVARDFGMTGEWALDCSRPPAPDNAHNSFTLADDGSVSRTLTMQVQGLDGVTALHDLRRVAPDLLSSSWTRTSDGATVTLIVQREGNREHGWESIDSTGLVLISKGIFNHSGKPAPWFEKCEP